MLQIYCIVQGHGHKQPPQHEHRGIKMCFVELFTFKVHNNRYFYSHKVWNDNVITTWAYSDEPTPNHCLSVLCVHWKTSSFCTVTQTEPHNTIPDKQQVVFMLVHRTRRRGGEMGGAGAEPDVVDIWGSGEFFPPIYSCYRHYISSFLW